MNSTIAPTQDHLHRFDAADSAMAIADTAGTIIRVNQALCDLIGRPMEAVLAAPYHELYTPEDRLAVTEAVLEVRTGLATACQTERRLQHADGRALELLVTLVPLVDEGDNRRGVLFHMHEPATRPASRRRKRHVAVVGEHGAGASTDRAKVHAAREAILAALGQRVLAGLELDPLMGDVVRIVAATLGVEHAAILEIRPGGAAMRLRAAVGWDDDHLGLTLLNPPASAPGTPPLTASPLGLAELLGPERAATLAGHGVHDGGIALIGWPGEPVGVLAVYATSPHALAPGDLEFLQAMADVVASAMEHRRAEANRRRLLDATLQASEHERAQFSAALHEGPVQNFSVLSLRLEQARVQLAQGKLEATQRLLGQLQEAMADEIAGLRRLLRELRPPALDERGLTEAVRDQVQAFRHMTDLECVFESTLAERLRPELETLLYRVTQEALANLARQARVEHAKVERVRVALYAVADSVELRIADEEPAVAPAPGRPAVVELDTGRAARHGLDEVRAQVEQAGGRWELTSTPDGGTVIGVSFNQTGA